MRSTGSRDLFKATVATPALPRVLFVCLGNVCRSQMAEGFGHKYGAGIFATSSAGLAPGLMVDPLTQLVMLERGCDLERQFPKTIAMGAPRGAELVVNMSGYPLPANVTWPSMEWKVPDPHTKAVGYHREIRDLVEHLVMQLVLEYRTKRR